MCCTQDLEAAAGIPSDSSVHTDDSELPNASNSSVHTDDSELPSADSALASTSTGSMPSLIADTDDELLDDLFNYGNEEVCKARSVGVNGCGIKHCVVHS